MTVIIGVTHTVHGDGGDRGCERERERKRAS